MNAVKTAGSNLAKFGSAAGGLVVGSLVMKRIPAFGPPVVQKILPGLVGMVLAYFISKKFSNEHVRSAALGLGLAGFVDVVKKFTAGSTGILSTVNSALPSLSGVGSYVQNHGQYPPTYLANNLGNASADPYGLGNAMLLQ